MAFYQSDKFTQAPETEVKKYEESYAKMEVRKAIGMHAYTLTNLRYRKREYKRRRRTCKDGLS